MFIAGVVVGGVIAGAIAHEDHSRYDDYSDVYSDADLVNKIKATRTQREQKEEEWVRLENELRNTFYEELSYLRGEGLIDDFLKLKNLNNFDYDDGDKLDNLRSAMKSYVRNKLNDELEVDRQQLADIDATIAKINEIQLTAKQK